MDFTDGQPVYENIAKQLADLDIGILGMWYGIIIMCCCTGRQMTLYLNINYHVWRH